MYQRITVLMKERIYNVEHKTWEVFKHKAFNACENRRNFHGCFYENNQGRFCRKMKAATWWVSWEKVLLNVRLKHLKTTYSRVDFLVIFRMQACNFNKNELISQEFFKYFNRRFNWFLLGKLYGKSCFQIILSVAACFLKTLFYNYRVRNSRNVKIFYKKA